MCGIKIPLQNFALKMQGEFMREGIFAGHYGNTIFCPTASCIYYCSLAKEQPWAEHLSSLPKSFHI